MFFIYLICVYFLTLIQLRIVNAILMIYLMADFITLTIVRLIKANWEYTLFYI